MRRCSLLVLCEEHYNKVYVYKGKTAAIYSSASKVSKFLRNCFNSHISLPPLPKMEAKSDKCGWVEKRSAYLKQWRTRWLVLANSCLCTYKTQNTAETPTERILLDSVVEVALMGDAQRPHCFKINTKTRLFILSVHQAAVALEWVGTIQGTIANPSSQLIERQRQSQQTLTASFASLQSLLKDRENCLCSELTSSHDRALSKAREELIAFNAAAKEIETSFEALKAIEGKQELSAVQKLVLVNALSQECRGFAEFDLLVDSAVTVFLPTKQRINDLMTSCISIALENPLEYQARRTSITRALKWMYDGERIDAITLSVSKAVLLTGVGFCRPCKPNGRILTKVLKVVQGTTTGGTVVYTHPVQSVIESDARDSVQKISLSPPVLLKGRATYTLTMKMDGSASYKCVDCTRSLLTEGEVTWTLATSVFPPTDQSNRTDVVCGPIADFYYMLVGDR